MAVYRTSKCPYCKTTLQYRKRTYWNDYTQDLGDPIDYCPTCKKPYKTGKERWSKMSNKKKNIIYLKLAISFVVQPFIYLVLIMLLWTVLALIFPKIPNPEEMDIMPKLMLIGYLVLLPITTWLLIVSFKQEIKEKN
jgi:hypothetical protein